MANTTELTQSQRTQIRTLAGANRQGSRPVVIVKGDAAPHVAGESFRYETKGGRPIHHPSAYSKKGFSNMVYHHSTARIEVGREWLEEHNWIARGDK